MKINNAMLNLNFGNIEIQLPCFKQKLSQIDELRIVLDKEKKYILYENDCALYAMQSCRELLKRTLDNKLELDGSINDDIGFLWNEYLHQLVSEKLNEKKFKHIDNYWIGTNYSMWETQDLDTWMYQKNNKIILEITPIYPFFHRDPQPGENYITYEEFMKNYKPLEIIELDKETIKKWLEQTEELLAIMKTNEEKAEKEYEAKQQKS